ncbi:MAG: RidA family protein [Actinobacteria bacterium]|nr:RidA family protein [Actinomycetota bacterium]
MERRLVAAAGPFAPVVGYSRAVRVGPHVFVAGTAPIMADGSGPPADAYAQAKRCLEIIATALADAGASLGDVVRTRVYLVDSADFEDVARAHGEAFADIRPANTTLAVKEFVDPRWLVEIEVDAVVDGR